MVMETLLAIMYWKDHISRRVTKPIPPPPLVHLSVAIVHLSVAMREKDLSREERVARPLKELTRQRIVIQ